MVSYTKSSFYSTGATFTGGNKKPILIIDDDLIDRRYLERWCKKHGINYDTAENGLEAQELMKKNEYALIFSDIDMPIIDGVKLVKSIRQEENISRKHLPVVAISGNEQIFEATSAETLGFDMHIPKPACPDSIAYAITKFYNKNY